ncbi:MAG: hypothetical protein P4L56_29165 [Candidatus Sulfopaludibacter sp.]|nr:hypothetical protein [Candidatus Sulfopaludibacter sp.]
MIATQYAIRLRVADPDGALIHSEEVREWGPAYEDMLFDAVLDGTLPNNGALPDAALDPLCQGERVSGFRLSLNGASKEYPLAILADRVGQIVSQARLTPRKEEEAAPAGDYTWEVVAKEKDFPPRTRGVRMKRNPYPLLPAPPAAAAALGQGVTLALSQRLAAELARGAAESWNCERAQLLAGWVVRTRSGAVVIADRAYPVDMGVTATLASIDFSPESFHRAVQHLNRRGEGRVPVGWHHNHPPPCSRQCPADAPACASSSVFFSLDDRVVHRSYFSVPYMFAVVSGKGTGRRLDDPEQRAYGWRGGIIHEIAFSTYEETEP